MKGILSSRFGGFVHSCLLVVAVLVGIAYFAPAHAQTPPTISVSPTSADRSAIPVVTWNAPGASSCVASGGWSGTKAASGTQTLAAITAGATFTINCSYPGAAAQPGRKTVNWIAPTTNTNGSPLTNLTGFRVDYGTSASAMDTSFYVEGAGVRSWTTPSLPYGRYYFVVRAVNSAGAESDNSSPVVEAVVGTPAGSPTTASASATLTIRPVPNPPTGVSVVDVNATVYNIAVGSDGLSLVAGSAVGFMRQAATCGDQVSASNATLRVVPKSRVHFREWVPSTAPVVARCS